MEAALVPPPPRWAALPPPAPPPHPLGGWPRGAPRPPPQPTSAIYKDMARAMSAGTGSYPEGSIEYPARPWLRERTAVE